MFVNRCSRFSEFLRSGMGYNVHVRTARKPDENCQNMVKIAGFFHVNRCLEQMFDLLKMARFQGKSEYKSPSNRRFLPCRGMSV